MREREKDFAYVFIFALNETDKESGKKGQDKTTEPTNYNEKKIESW